MTRTLETNKYMKKILILGAIIAAASTASAKVTLPRIFSNGMVMQQQTEANLWGTAKANATVKITASWNKKTITTKTDNDGKWKVSITTPSAGGPYSITFNDGERLLSTTYSWANCGYVPDKAIWRCR